MKQTQAGLYVPQDECPGCREREVRIAGLEAHVEALKDLERAVGGTFANRQLRRALTGSARSGKKGRRPAHGSGPSEKARERARKER